MPHTLLHIAAPLATLAAALLALRWFIRREIAAHDRRHQQELADLRSRLDQMVHQSDPDHPAPKPD